MSDRRAAAFAAASRHLATLLRDGLSLNPEEGNDYGLLGRPTLMEIKRKRRRRTFDRDVVLLPGHAAGHEDAEAPDRLVDGVDDGLVVHPYVLDTPVQIEEPAKRLLQRRDVVALRTEHDNGGADDAEVDLHPIAGDDVARAELVPDEQLVAC